MPDVEIRFTREGVDGIVAVDSSLVDTARRFGIRFEPACEPRKGLHHCALVVTSGVGSLSPVTSTETEHFGVHGRRSNERLACEARITSSGEIVIMTDEKKQEPKKTEAPKDRFQAEFEALPLEKKIASLMRMEVVTLSETFAYVLNSPLKVVEKVGDVISEFGIRIENEARKAARQAKTKAEAKPPTGGTAKPKGRTRRKPAPPSAKA